MTHNLPEGVVRFTNRTDEVAYKMPHKIEHYNSLSDVEKEHTKLVYLRNKEDKRKGVEYVMSKILGFYKECLQLEPEYVTGLDDEGEVTDHPIFIHDNEKHSVQNEESLENSSNEIAASNSNQEKEEPPQDSEIHQIIREECCIEVCENALNSKLLSINSTSQHFDKKEQEVKNVMEQPAERGTRIKKPLQNFRVIHKSSISLNNTSQIFLVYAVASILSTKEPEHSLSMEYEHLSITPETESDKVTKSNAKNLLPIPSECEVTSEDESKCDMPAKDDSSPAFTTFSNPLFDNNDNLDSSDNESLPEEDVMTEEFKEFSSELTHINPKIKESNFDFEEEIHLIENLLYDNSSSRPPKEHNAKEERIKNEHVDYISRMEMLFTINPRPRPMVNANIIVESLLSLPIIVQDGDSQKEEIDIVTNTDELLPPGFENNDSEGEINAVDELHVDNSISNSSNEFFDNEASDFDNPSFP
nr:retrotransposon Orf1 [Tanacetum cinerariifolium]